ncbi:MAG: hypothetical protein H7Z71_09295 [Moraxellaceae bacterium]|nr:hypothetical protein [Pseudobdellovibrionaceae bacterium]
MLVLDMQVMKKYLDHGYKIAQPLVAPLLNYALGWFSPELLGSGFVIKSIDDHAVVGSIPYSKFNCNNRSEIHAGLVVNSGFELIQCLLARHLGHTHFAIESFETTLKKSSRWDNSLLLKIELNEVVFDRFFMDLQKDTTTPLQCDVTIQKKSAKPGFKSKDIIKFNLTVRSKKLIA